MSRQKGQRVECQVCRHADRLEIEQVRFTGHSLDDCARDYGVKRDAVARHMAKHLSAARKKQLEEGPRSIPQLLNLTRDLKADAEDRLRAMLASAYRMSHQMAQRGSSNVQTFVMLGRFIRDLEGEIEERVERSLPTGGRLIEGSAAPQDDAHLEALVLDEFRDDPEALARLSRRLRGEAPALPAPAPGGADAA